MSGTAYRRRAPTMTSARLAALAITATLLSSCDRSPPPVSAPADATAVAHHTCPMHPTIENPGPGRCPICSMPLEPVTAAERDSGEVRVDSGRLQLIGVRTAPVTRRKTTIRLRLPGRVTYDETRVHDVSLRYPAWIGQLHVDRSGSFVRKGDILFSVYSYDLYIAQRELIGAHELEQRGGVSQVQDARDRLQRLDVAAPQIDAIAQRTSEMEYVPIASAVSGWVIEKNVVAGGGVQAGARLYRIARLDRVWVEAEVYLDDLPLVVTGQPASIQASHLAGDRFAGQVDFIYPFIAEGSPTGRVRIELPNPDLALRPGAFVDVHLAIDRGERLIVPEAAVIYAGPRRLVFIDGGAGRFRPRAVEVGRKTEAGYEVLSGLTPGEQVVTSGNFLIAAESRLKSAAGSW